MFRSILLVLLASVAMTACFNDKRDQLYPAPTVCDTSGVTYSGFVRQIVGGSTCSKDGCHNTASAQSGVTLDNYNGVRAAAQNGSLLGVLDWSNNNYPHMPQDGGQLDACTIARISAWVAKGAPNN